MISYRDKISTQAKMREKCVAEEILFYVCIIV